MDREEALKKVRQMSLPKETMEILEALAPELAESEDERIRKEIVDFIRWAIDRGSITKEQREKSDTWFSYLEKQKDIEDRWIEDRGQCFWDGVEEGKMLAEKQREQKLPLMDGDTDTYFDDLRMTTKPLTSREWFEEGIRYAQRLQKEQKQPEVYLNENTMKEEFRMIDSACLLFNYDKLSREQLIARRFYQLGLKAK